MTGRNIMDDEKPFLVAACCRSGTQTLTKALEGHKIAVRHEHIGRDGCVSGVLNVPGKVPCVDRALDLDCFGRVVIVARHPLRVLESLMIEPYHVVKFVVYHSQCLPKTPDKLTWLCAGWYWFYMRLLKARPDSPLYRIEDLSTDLHKWSDFLLDIMPGMVHSVKPMPGDFRGTGHKPETWTKRHPRPSLTWTDLEKCGRAGGWVKELAREVFGYE